jgi:DNA-binding transcriptional MerR regulator
MYRPKEAADRLGIAAVTLRAWSNEFASFLSDAARKTITGRGQAAQRRYTDNDIAILQRAKRLLGSGATYDEARRRLADDPDLASEIAPEPAALATIEQATAILASLQTSYETALQAKDEALSQQQAHIESLKEQIAQQQAELERLRLPWWKRWR